MTRYNNVNDADHSDNRMIPRFRSSLFGWNDESFPLLAEQTSSRSIGSMGMDTYEDNEAEITWGRRLARILSKYSWYYPHQGSHPNAPSLDRAWSYFEHVTLARHVREMDRSISVHRKAGAGEDIIPTKLYSVIHTSEDELASFGIGIGLYFYTLRLLFIVMLLAGMINIPNQMYYFSDNYSSANKQISILSLRSSAICTSEAWAPCPSCTKSDWDRFPPTYDRYAQVQLEDGTLLSFIKITNCDITNQVGLVSYASLLFIFLAIFLLHQLIKREQVKLDYASLTTTDYAVEVTNPPPDARNPDEWKAFFEQFGQVASITITLNNDDLLRALLQRRKLLMALEDLLPPGIKLNISNLSEAVEKAMSLTMLQTIMMMDKAPSIKSKIEDLDARIRNDLSQRHYRVTNVFVVFEKETSQINALQALKVGGIHVVRNNIAVIQENLRFRGQFILSVDEPQEPSSIRWQDIDDSFLVQFLQRCVTFSTTIVLIVIFCYIVVHVRNTRGSTYAALTITATNSVFPTFCLYITDAESHPSEGSRQASYYFKITAAFWILTTILTAYLTPFTDTLHNQPKSLIPAMYAIFITELLKTPITQVLDIPGHVYRHVLAPRAPDQRRMNAYFSGTRYYLSERYTDMTNVLFLTFFYALLFPAGFFWASGTLGVRYWVDKFCLLRNWAPAPSIGTPIADLSRIYFFPAAVVAYAIMSSYNFASFPYDNACKLNQTVSQLYIGNFTGTTADGESVRIAISNGDTVYKYCNQDMLRYNPRPAFPAIPTSQPKGGEWMEPGQDFTVIFGWTSVIVIAFVGLLYLEAFRKRIHHFLYGGYCREDKPRNLNFSETPGIYGYIPQVKLEGALYPTLFCDISKISHTLIDWEDPADPTKDIHNAIYDLPGLNKKSDSESIFSIVKEWGPLQNQVGSVQPI